MRIAITGPPKAGKSTLAVTLSRVLGIPVYHTDELKNLDWSTASEEVSMWFSRPDPWIIEGVTVPRALRKWKARHNELIEPPLDRLVLLATPREPLLLQGQRTMATQVLELIQEYRPWIGPRWVDL